MDFNIWLIVITYWNVRDDYSLTNNVCIYVVLTRMKRVESRILPQKQPK